MIGYSNKRTSKGRKSLLWLTVLEGTFHHGGEGMAIITWGCIRFGIDQQNHMFWQVTMKSQWLLLSTHMHMGGDCGVRFHWLLASQTFFSPSVVILVSCSQSETLAIEDPRLTAYHRPTERRQLQSYFQHTFPWSTLWLDLPGFRLPLSILSFWLMLALPVDWIDFSSVFPFPLNSLPPLSLCHTAHSKYISNDIQMELLVL